MDACCRRFLDGDVRDGANAGNFFDANHGATNGRGATAGIRVGLGFCCPRSNVPGSTYDPFRHKSPPVVEAGDLHAECAGGRPRVLRDDLPVRH